MTTNTGFFGYTEPQLVDHIITGFTTFKRRATRYTVRNAINAFFKQAKVKELIDACENGTLKSLDSRVALHRFADRMVKLQLLFKWVDDGKVTEYIDSIRKKYVNEQIGSAFELIREMIAAFSIYVEDIASPLSEQLKKEYKDNDDPDSDQASLVSWVVRVHLLICIKHANYDKEGLQWQLRYARRLVDTVGALMEFMLHKLEHHEVFAAYLKDGFLLQDKITFRGIWEDDEVDDDENDPMFDEYYTDSSSNDEEVEKKE